MFAEVRAKNVKGHLLLGHSVYRMKKGAAG